MTILLKRRHLALLENVSAGSLKGMNDKLYKDTLDILVPAILNQSHPLYLSFSLFSNQNKVPRRSTILSSASTSSL